MQSPATESNTSQVPPRCGECNFSVRIINTSYLKSVEHVDAHGPSKRSCGRCLLKEVVSVS